MKSSNKDVLLPNSKPKMKTLRYLSIVLLTVMTMFTVGCELDKQKDKIANIAENTYVVIKRAQGVLDTIADKAGSIPGAATITKNSQSIRGALEAVEDALVTVGNLAGRDFTTVQALNAGDADSLDESVKKLKESLK